MATQTRVCLCCPLQVFPLAKPLITSWGSGEVKKIPVLTFFFYSVPFEKRLWKLREVAESWRPGSSSNICWGSTRNTQVCTWSICIQLSWEGKKGSKYEDALGKVLCPQFPGLKIQVPWIARATARLYGKQDFLTLDFWRGEHPQKVQAPAYLDCNFLSLKKNRKQTFLSFSCLAFKHVITNQEKK